MSLACQKLGGSSADSEREEVAMWLDAEVDKGHQSYIPLGGSCAEPKACSIST